MVTDVYWIIASVLSRMLRQGSFRNYFLFPGALVISMKICAAVAVVVTDKVLDKSKIQALKDFSVKCILTEVDYNIVELNFVMN